MVHNTMLRTKDQKKNICTGCPIAKAANLIGDTWAILIVRDLMKGPKRFGDFLASLQGTSSRTLTKKLHFLEEHDIIARKEFVERPPRVMYSLTKKGKEFNKVLQALGTYGEKYL